MRPDFGSGLLQLVFAPNSPKLAATTQMLVQGALQQWLGEIVTIEGVSVEAVDATLRVTVQYADPRSARRGTSPPSSAGGAVSYRAATTCAATAWPRIRTLNGIEYLEVSIARRRPEARASARSSSACCSRCPCLTPTNVHLRAASGSATSRSSGWPRPAHRPRRRRPPPSRRSSPRCRRPTTCWSCARAHGDFSPYTLRLQRSATDARAPRGFDPLLVEVVVLLQGRVPDRLRLRAGDDCPEPGVPAPEIDYLAKDYASFRRLMLDRLSLLAPDWTERHRPTSASTLVELLAYVADELSYRQDAVATEAYLETARQRTSLRRHARLVDYRLHEGCNARAWVQLTLAGMSRSDHSAGRPALPLARAGSQAACAGRSRVQCLSRGLRGASGGVRAARSGRQAPARVRRVDCARRGARRDAALHVGRPSAAACRGGATSATLSGHFDKLEAGHVLVFEEVLGPSTGVASDADPAHRHAVRLTDVQCLDLDPDPSRAPCATARSADDGADHRDRAGPRRMRCRFRCAFRPAPTTSTAAIIDGQRGARQHRARRPWLDIEAEDLGAVPLPFAYPRPTRDGEPVRTGASRAGAAALSACGWRIARSRTSRRCERLQATPGGGTSPDRVAFNPEAPAAEAFSWRSADVMPAMTLSSAIASGSPPVTEPWDARRDLLGSDGETPDFVVRGRARRRRATLRFGDDQHGRRAEHGTAFTATYRVGQRRRRQRRRRCDRARRDATTRASLACATRCPLAAGPSRKPRSRSAATRRRRSAPRSARSRRTTTRPWPAVRPACSAPRPRRAGPAAGTRCSSRSTASAARR